MSDERDDKQAPYARSPLDTRTAEVITAIVAFVCVALSAVIVVAALLGVWPW